MVLFTHGSDINATDDPCRLSLKPLIDTRYSDSYKTLRMIARATLGSYYDDLKQFYSEIFMSGECQYVVFVARRSIGLAEIFLIILWHENPSPAFRDRLERCWANATTDSTILSCADEIARGLMLGYCPKVMIVDDLLVQGNGVNELLSTIEESVVHQLQSLNDSTDTGSYWKDLVNSIRIRVFAQNSTVSVVKLQYQLQLKAKYRMQPKEWHDFSRRISALIRYCGTVNATFIMGAELSAGSVKRKLLDTGLQLDGSATIEPVCEKKDTFYERYYFSWTEPRQLCPKYFCTLRAIKNQFSNTYLLLPFIFLPQLTERSYHYLKERVLKKWGINKDDCALFCEGDHTSRLEYEAMILHLSESLLMCWVQAAGIPLKRQHYIPTKVSLNYGINRLSPLMSQDMFYRLTNPAYLFTWNELTVLLNEVTADAEPLITVQPVTGVPEQIVYKQVEDEIYLTKLQELFESCRSSHLLPPECKPILKRTFKQTNWNIDLEEFTANICRDIQGLSAGHLFRILLNFMDQGILTLKIRESGTHFTQVLRMGEQSLFIWPQRYASYYPMLSFLEMRKAQFNTDFTSELRAFLNHEQSHGKLESDTDADTLTVELTKYLTMLRNSGQEPGDWDIDFEKSLLLDIGSEQADSRMRRLYSQERLNYMDATRIRWTLLHDCHSFYAS